MHETRGISVATLMLSTLAGSCLAATPLVRVSADAADNNAATSPERRVITRRAAIGPPDLSSVLGEPPAPAIFPMTYRAISGVNNNVANPMWGAHGAVHLRFAEATYGDGIGDLPGGADRPGPREVSNACHDQIVDVDNPKNASDYLWQWGQFIDHDVAETPIPETEHFDIDVPIGDPHFDPDSVGGLYIQFDRSEGVMVNGRREQLNNLTSYVDGSMVYGSEDEVAIHLRALDGTGRMLMGADGLLPSAEETGVFVFDNGDDPLLFAAGDVRVNEQAGLTAMHTLFVREHNWWAERVANRFPNLSGEDIYQYARAVVIAEIQQITYNEFLPLLLGEDAIPPYEGYDPDVNPTMSNEFATAAYRVGHTALSSNLKRLGADLEPTGSGNLQLADVFFNPALIIDEGIEPHLRGLAWQKAQAVDLQIVTDVRNFLFGQPGAGGFDLPSLNIQRARDHGLASYNQLREGYGLAPKATFADVNPDPAVIGMLSSVYDNTDLIDPWTGCLAEPTFPGALVGETMYTVIRDQFIRLRDGDRFWFERYLPERVVERVHNTKLSDIIRRNSPIGDEIPDNVFVVAGGCNAADLAAPFGDLDIADVVEFLRAFGDAEPAADLAEPTGAFDIADVVEFLRVFGAGCP